MFVDECISFSTFLFNLFFFFIIRASVELADDATLYESMMLFHWIFIINLYGSISVCLVYVGLQSLAADKHGSASDFCLVCETSACSLFYSLTHSLTHISSFDLCTH